MIHRKLFIAVLSVLNLFRCGAQTVSHNVDVMTITLSVYSGTRDPVFNIHSYNPDFASILADVMFRGSTPLGGVLGYHGFIINLYATHGPLTTRTITVGKCTNLPLEAKLLNTVSKLSDTTGHRLPQTVVQHVTESLKACI